MKQLLFVMLVIISQIVFGQKVNQCGFIVPPATAQSNFNSVYEASSYLNRMLRWMRFSNSSDAKRYKLQHGNDYAIIWSRRSNNWTITSVQ